jgi:hypothetical protein
MKKIIIFFFLISSIKILSNRINLSRGVAAAITFIGEVKVPTKNISNDFYVYFDGNFIPVEDGSFIFKSSVSKEINILITDPKNIEIKTEENNLATLTLKNNSIYYFYSISIKTLIGENTWDVRLVELPVFNNNKVIPLNTLIVPISTEFVEKDLENKTWKLNSASIKLPSIVLRGDENKIDQAIVKSCMAFIDFKAFHSRQKVREVNSDNLTVSMIV